jgi:methionyl-tRNA formyltransferase
VNEGIDTGDIIEQKKIFIKDNSLENLFINTYEIYKQLFRIVLRKFFLKRINRKKQILYKASYFQKLSSELDGKINFSWDAKYIELFIKAFSRPYKGAHCSINKRKIYILKAKFFKSKDNHPFLYGKIFRFTKDGSCYIFCKNGILKISDVSLDKISFKPSKIIKLKDKLI